MSSSSAASISLEAKTDTVQSIDLSDASIQLAVKAFKDLAIEIPTAGNLSPLLGLSGIHGGIFSDDTFGPDLSQLLAGAHSKVKQPPMSFGNFI
jgi:hypothetical protein